MNKTPKKFRIVITYPFPLGKASGGARMTREIARHLGKLGTDVILLPVSASLARRYPRPKVEDKLLGFEFDEELSRDSVTTRRVPQNALYWGFDGLPVKTSLRKILADQRVDIVLSYYNEAAFLPSLLRAHHVKFGYISTWQSYAVAIAPPWNFERFFWKYLIDNVVIKPHRQADILFATSKFTRNELIDVLGVDQSRISVCYLGVAPHFMEIPREKPENITQFLFFGRVVPSKGVGDAIEALGALSRKGMTNWRFRILGQGQLDWARTAARENGIADKVTICGPANDVDLRRELEQAHLAIMPSHYEAFGLAFAEAQASGIPVIAYQAGSVPEIVENGATGWLAPLGDVNQLANLIEGAVQNPEGTFLAGLNGRERIMRLFTWENTAKTILTGITRILNG